jgi:hypothetical protein
MASFNGYYVTTDLPMPASDAFFGVGGNASVMGVPDVNYEMQAKDSVTLAVFRWIMPFADYAGTGYPGPNSPTEIAVRQTDPL